MPVHKPQPTFLKTMNPSHSKALGIALSACLLLA